MIQIWVSLLQDTAIETLQLFFYLFLTYLILEYIEHKTNYKNMHFLGKGGLFAPMVGALLGTVPQCGISAAAANFYAARVISTGTLIAVFLSTSDEMIPILLSNGIAFSIIFKILAWKTGIALIIGVLIDFILNKKNKGSPIPLKIEELCQGTCCHCDKGIFLSAFWHTIQILVFIFFISLILNTLIALIGIDSLETLIFKKPLIGELFAGLAGLIPNCAASVIITQLYVENTLSAGAFISGLLTNTGVGFLVLFRINRPMRQNIQLMLFIYIISVIIGVLINFFGISFS